MFLFLSPVGRAVNFLPLVLVLLLSFNWAFLRLVGAARCDVSFSLFRSGACQKSSIGRNGLLFHNVLHFLGCHICSGILRSWSYHGHASFFIMLAQHC